MRLTRQQPRREAFTLVEMMVAMALTVFILVILSQAFGTGMETFRSLKAIGDMQQGLRTVSVRLRADLAYDHFEGQRRVSDAENFWITGKPANGFFCIKQGSPSVLEGNDLDGLPCYHATNHILWFSIKSRGARRENFFMANVPAIVAGLPSPLLTPSNTSMLPSVTPDNVWQPLNNGTTGTYTSQWAEVAYFLVPTGDSNLPGQPPGTAATMGGTPLFTLYRAQRVVVPFNGNSNLVGQVPGPAIPNYADMSCQADLNNAGFLYFNSPTDLANGIRAITFPVPPAAPPSYWAPLLTNVVSFQVQVMWGGSKTFSDLNPALGWTNYVFDTAAIPPLTAGNNKNAPTISAVQITVRVWDVQTQQTRQLTVIQDL